MAEISSWVKTSLRDVPPINIPRLIYKHLHVTKMAVTIKTTEVFGDNERHYAVQRLDLV